MPEIKMANPRPLARATITEALIDVQTTPRKGLTPSDLNAAFAELDFGYYAKSPMKSPLGPEKGDGRVVRGGSWFNDSRLARSACRVDDLPVNRYINVGCRVVWSVGARTR